MRTKLLLTAAALAAGIATSMAQPVYSVNVVGYINLTAKPGYNLVANQLVNAQNTLDQVLPGVPPDSLVLTYSAGSYIVDVYDGTAWLDNETGDPSATAIAPGKGFFFYNPTATDQTITLVGEVKQGETCVPLPAGYSLISVVAPQSIPLTPANDFANVPDMLYFGYDAVAASYKNVLVNDGSGWLDNESGDPAVAQPEVGEGFFIYNPGPNNADWCRTFNVQ
jgi:hypothetical protein